MTNFSGFTRYGLMPHNKSQTNSDNLVAKYVMFITGEPHYSTTHPDYVPSVFPSAYGNQARVGQRQRKERLDRIRKRYEKQAQREADKEAARLQAEEEART